jgi:hypothetical protein
MSFPDTLVRRRSLNPQWERAEGVTPAFHIPVIYLTRGSFDSNDAEAVVRCNTGAVNRLLNGFVEPHEIHADAMRSYNVDYYVSQVSGGGHAQFAADAQGQLLTHRFLRQGLEAMGAEAHLAIYDELMRLLDTGDSRVRASVASRGFCAEGSPLTELDGRFRACERTQPLALVNGMWLRSRSSIRLVDDARIEIKLDDLIASHPFHAERLKMSDRAWRSRRVSDPHTAMALRLCKLIDREWQGWTTRVPGRVEIAPGQIIETIAWSGRTSEGPCLLYFLEGRAYLIDQANSRLLVSLSMQS